MNACRVKKGEWVSAMDGLFSKHTYKEYCAVSDQFQRNVGSLRNEGTYHIQNVCIAGSKGLFGNIQKPRSKVPPWRFLVTFNVEARQSKECQNDLY
jgi:hypothetical protein